MKVGLKIIKSCYNNLNDAVPDSIRQNVQAEVIFLTHNKDLHELNLKWHPKGEELIWSPSLQETKVSQTGGQNLRYQWKLKNKMMHMFGDIIDEVSPWLQIRYMF